MISLVCVYNNKTVLDNVLLKSLARQSVNYELITLDNTDNKFKSAAEALNYGGANSRGDYIMFVHQDMWLGEDAFIENTEKILNSIPDVGISGVAGVDNKRGTWKENVKYSIFVSGNPWWDDIRAVKKPEEVFTLDECLLTIPKTVFNRIKFDEKIFDGWDCYGADYCLAIKKFGLKAYVLPPRCSHSCLRANYDLWEFKSLHKYQKRLLKKYNYKYINTWMAGISKKFLLWINILSILKPLYLMLFPDFQIRLKREISGYNSILDLGCGHHSPLYRYSVSFSAGLEIFFPSLIESKRLNIHNNYVHADIRNIEFKDKSFDVVIAIDVLQNLTKEDGKKLLVNIERWARKKIIIKTPNGFVRQKAFNDNPYLEHVSGWDAGDFQKLGYEVHGIGGLKFLEKDEEYHDKIKYNFWRERVANLTNGILYYFLPESARQLFAVKTIK